MKTNLTIYFYHYTQRHEQGDEHYILLTYSRQTAGVNEVSLFEKENSFRHKLYFLVHTLDLPLISILTSFDTLDLELKSNIICRYINH